MQKTARKPSSDPLQEKLRTDKATWNKEMSAFINDVIHLKKTMNGWPSKFYKERSRIGDPIPADPTTIIGSLAGDFQELAQKGNTIVQEQLNYSKNRKKRQMKQLNLPMTQQPPQTDAPKEEPKPPVDLTKQLSLPLAAAKFEKKYGLVAEGSNPLTRLYTRVVTPTRGFSAGARTRRLRMDLLKAAITTYRDLGRLQVHIVGSGKDSATHAYKEMQKTWNDWTLVARGFNMFRNTQPGGSLVPSTDIENNPELKSEKPEEQDKLEGGEDPLTDQPKSSPSGIPTKNIIPPTSQPGSNQVVPFGTKPMQTAAAYQLEVTAQAFLKKWLGKTRHQLLPKTTSSYRMEIFKLAASARKNINRIMDHLEKGLDANTLHPMIIEVNKEMTSLRLLVRSVHFAEKPGEAQPMGMF